jgi:hypothetical protein
LNFYRVSVTVDLSIHQTINKMQASNKCSKFTEEEVCAMKKIIAADINSAKEQSIHGFHQMWRFAHLAQTGQSKFRKLQFGLNLGRTQEILGSIGGVNAWWRVFEPICEAKNYEKIINTVKEYLHILELPEPDSAFINRV